MRFILRFIGAVSHLPHLHSHLRSHDNKVSLYQQLHSARMSRPAFVGYLPFIACWAITFGAVFDKQNSSHRQVQTKIQNALKRAQLDEHNIRGTLVRTFREGMTCLASLPLIHTALQSAGFILPQGHGATESAAYEPIATASISPVAVAARPVEPAADSAVPVPVLENARGQPAKRPGNASSPTWQCGLSPVREREVDISTSSGGTTQHSSIGADMSGSHLVGTPGPAGAGTANGNQKFTFNMPLYMKHWDPRMGAPKAAAAPQPRAVEQRAPPAAPPAAPCATPVRPTAPAPVPTSATAATAAALQTPTVEFNLPVPGEKRTRAVLTERKQVGFTPTCETPTVALSHDPSKPSISSSVVMHTPASAVRRPQPAAAPFVTPLPAAAPAAAAQPTPQQTGHAALAALQATVREKNILWVNNVPYAKLGVLGRGGSSKVFRALSPTHQVVAVKRVRLARMSKSAASSFANEIMLLEQLRGSSHIIELLDSLLDIPKKTIYMVLEAGDADLARVLAAERSFHAQAAGGSPEAGSQAWQLDPNFLRTTWQGMLRAVQTIHQARIVHSDLKPANFVFVQGVLKLIDFGIAKAMADDTMNIYRNSQAGTLNYMSPEAITGSQGNGEVGQTKLRVGQPSDVWSLGCILYQMAYGTAPFSGLGMQQKMFAIIDPKHTISFPELPGHTGAAAREVMMACLNRDPTKRPSVEQLLEHPFLHDPAPPAVPMPPAVETPLAPAPAAAASAPAVPPGTMLVSMSALASLLAGASEPAMSAAMKSAEGGATQAAQAIAEQLLQQTQRRPALLGPASSSGSSVVRVLNIAAAATAAGVLQSSAAQPAARGAPISLPASTTAAPAPARRFGAELPHNFADMLKSATAALKPVTHAGTQPKPGHENLPGSLAAALARRCAAFHPQDESTVDDTAWSTV